MRMLCNALVSLSVALTAAAAIHAQDASANSDEIIRCADWVKETVPANVRIVGADFCRGIKPEGSPTGWYSIENCGEQRGGKESSARAFCASSGQIGPDWTVGAGYTGSKPDGGELFSGMHEGGASRFATLYSRTPLHIGDMRIPSGFSHLSFSQTDRGWQMTIAPEKEKATIAVQLLSDSRQLSATGSELAVGVHYASPRCPDLLNMRELVFTYAGTDLYVCMRPDHIPPMSDESAATR